MNDNGAMPARLSAFVIWALVAAGLMFWGYRLWARPMAVPANLQVVSESAGARGDLTRLLGAAPVAVSGAPTPVVESNRFRLLGVLAPLPANGAAKPSTAGVALIAVDGKPARPYAVGARLEGEMVLQSISRRAASIGPAQGAPSVVLELPPPAPPATGALPRAVPDGSPARVQPAPAPLPISPPAQAQPQQQPPPQMVDAAPDDEATLPQPRNSGRVNPAMR